MVTSIEERAKELASYIIENKATIRETAKHFGTSKSTVHKDLTERLPPIDRLLALEVRQILDQNKAERHIRGGNATKQKYRQIRRNGRDKCQCKSLK